MTLRSLSQSRVLDTANAMAVTAYSILGVFLLPQLLAWTGGVGAAATVLTILVSSVSLYALVKLSIRGLLHVWARPILGRWAYESSSGNFALLHFAVDDYSLDYRVDVYRRLEDILGALRGDPGAIANAVAHAKKRALTYEDGYVSVIYSIKRASPTYEPREGILHVELLAGGEAMKGYWKSDIQGEPSRGELTIFRPEPFRRIYEPRLGGGSANGSTEVDGSASVATRPAHPAPETENR